MKFRKIDYVSVFIILIVSHYLSFYDYAKSHNLYSSKFEFQNGIDPKDLSYLLIIALLIFLITKLFYFYFPNSNKENLLRYYQELLYQQEYKSLVNLISKFHGSDIISFYKNLKPDISESDYGFLRSRPKNPRWKRLINWTIENIRKAYKNVFSNSKSNRNEYASLITWDIIGRSEFLENCTELNPKLFSSIIAEIKGDKDRYIDSNFPINFFSVLVRNKNYTLYQELKETDTFIGPKETYVIPEDRFILNSIFKDISVVSHNKIWKAFGTAAFDEVRYERIKKEDSYLNHKLVDEDNLWKTKIIPLIHFYDILIRIGICEKNEDQLWVSYNNLIISDMCTNLGKIDPKRIEKESYYFGLIDKIFDNYYTWLNIIIKIHPEKYRRTFCDLLRDFRNKDNYDQFKSFPYQSIIRDIGQSIYHLTNTPTIKSEYIQSKMNRLLEFYNDMIYHKFEDEFKTAIEKLFVEAHLVKDQDYFNQIISSTFSNLDYPVFTSYSSEPNLRLQRLYKNIVIPKNIEIEELNYYFPK